MPKRKNLSDTQKAAIKASYDQHKLAGKTKQAAMELVAEEWGVHWQTIRKILQGASGINPKIEKDIKATQASKIDQIVEKLLDHTNKEDIIKKLSGAQSAMAICQLIDKALKLRGEDVTKVEIFEVGEKVRKRLDELRSMREALQKSMTVPETSENN